MPPNDLLNQISIYFEQVSSAIADEHGTVDKFIGDGVMAFWGAPLPVTDEVLHACRGALRAVRRMERTNETWRSKGRAPFRIRIGLNSADVLVGNVGSSERFSYTVMGDGVNVAARLEGMNKTFGLGFSCESGLSKERCRGDKLFAVVYLSSSTTLRAASKASVLECPTQ